VRETTMATFPVKSEWNFDDSLSESESESKGERCQIDPDGHVSRYVACVKKNWQYLDDPLVL